MFSILLVIFFVPFGYFFREYHGYDNRLWFYLLFLTVGPALSVFQIYFSAEVYKFAGRLFGGKASSKDLRSISVWSLTPFICAFIPITVIFGIFVRNDGRIGRELFPLMDILMIIALIFLFYDYILIVLMVSEVHKLTIFKAIVVVVISFFVQRLLNSVMQIAVTRINDHFWPLENNDWLVSFLSIR